MLTLACMRYRIIYDKKRIKKCGKAVDCDFCRSLWELFVVLYIGRNKTEEKEKSERRIWLWIRLLKRF